MEKQYNLKYHSLSTYLEYLGPIFDIRPVLVVVGSLFKPG